MRKFNAFTLAEVLITLGIIGVVAAMTMPTLMNQTNGAQYKAAYKKALSAIAQGVTLNVALDGGSFADAIKGTAGKTDKVKCNESATTAECDSVASILGSRMNVVRTDGTPGYSISNASTTATLITPTTTLFFNDGSVFAFVNDDAVACTANNQGATPKICEGFIDVNGAKGPNKVVNCDTATATAKNTYTNGVKTEAASCTVSNPTDVYPVHFYDQTIVPATNAAAAVLYGK